MKLKIVQISQTKIQREKNNEQNRAVYIKQNTSNNIKRCSIPITEISEGEEKEGGEEETLEAMMLNRFFSCCSVAQLCPTLCDFADCGTPGFPVHHQLLKLAQTHVQ